jgi:hypothetical protein
MTMVRNDQFWQKHFPQAVSSKRVVLEAHNLFDVQNRKGVRVFFVRFVIREWNDETAVKILQNVSHFGLGCVSMTVGTNTGADDSFTMNGKQQQQQKMIAF